MRFGRSIYDMNFGDAALEAIYQMTFSILNGEAMQFKSSNSLGRPGELTWPKSHYRRRFNMQRRRNLTVLLSLSLLSLAVAAHAHRSPAPATLKDAFRGDFLVGAAIDADQFTGKDTRGTTIISSNSTPSVQRMC